MLLLLHAAGFDRRSAFSAVLGESNAWPSTDVQRKMI